MSENNHTMKCFFCDGHGSIRFANPAFSPMRCQRCRGSGRIPGIHSAWREKGQQLCKERRERRVGMQAEAARYGILPSLLSDYEQGWRNPDELPPPPTTETQ